MEIDIFLEKMSELHASDLYLTTGAPPTLKVEGNLVPFHNVPFLQGEVKRLAYELMNPTQRQNFELQLEMNFAYILSNNRRFRINVFLQQSEIGMVIRRIYTTIPTLDELGLPDVIKQLSLEKQGLILVAGTTGSGKSTSLASIINYRNEMTEGHIITIEDPIEFVHSHKKSIVTQREVGMDTTSYPTALINALRQSPDVILVGEIRTQEVMEQALIFSETGHLCLSTLHANNADQAFDRMLYLFEKGHREQLLLDLSANIKAIVSQRLVINKQGTLSLAVEIMINTPYIASLIYRGDFGSLKEAMEKSTNVGMQTFDQNLEELYFAGKITLEEALKNADSKNNLRLKIESRNKPNASPPPPSPPPDHSKVLNKDKKKENEPNKGLKLIDDD